MDDKRINELANEAMESIETDDGEDYAFARVAIEVAIKTALAEQRREDPEPTIDPVDEWELRKRGGKWLAAARSWLQHRRTTKGVHGDQITWGDHNAVFNISAHDVEELAARVAAGALNEHVDARAQIEYLRKRRFDAESQLAIVSARGERILQALERMAKATRRLVARGIIGARDFIDETNTKRWEDVFLAEWKARGGNESADGNPVAAER